MSEFEYQMVTTPEGVEEVIDAALAVPAYAVDTEFHRERTYFPKVALVQIGWGDGVALIDPLAVSLAPLARLLDGPGLAVMHAATQDLEVLTRACNTIPRRLFDTQVAAGFTGLRSPSLASLHDKLLGIRLPKGDRLTDWLRRPLSDTQLDYAASDVLHLLEIHRILEDDLTERGRMEWAADECEELRSKGYSERDPATAWLKIKETRHLGRKSRGVAQAIAEWREQRAQDLDQPPRFILPDLAVVGIAQRPAKSVDDMRKVRGLDDRHLRGDQGKLLLEIVKDGLTRDVELPKRSNQRVLIERLRPAVTLVSAWLAQYAQDIEIDPVLLGTRADIEALLRGDTDARLGTGWRNDHLGSPIRSLVDGKAALAFDNGRIFLEPRGDAGADA